MGDCGVCALLPWVLFALSFGATSKILSVPSREDVEQVTAVIVLIQLSIR